MKKSNPFQVVTGIFQSIPLMIGLAHACANAYNRKVGESDVTWDHTDPNFRLNVCGGIATDSAANVIAALRSGLNEEGNVSPEAYVQALKDMRDKNLNPLEKFIASNFPNTTWRTALYGREESRWSRAVNAQFCSLPEDEKPKDEDQYAAAAAYLLEQIELAGQMIEEPKEAVAA